MTFLRFIYTAASIITLLFLSLNVIQLYNYTVICLDIYLLTFECFWFEVIMIQAVMIAIMQIISWTYVIFSLG